MQPTWKIAAGVYTTIAGAALAMGGGTAASAQGAAECGSPGAACVVAAQCVQHCFPYGGRCSTVVGGGCCVCNR